MTHTTSGLPLIKPDKQSFVLQANLFNVVFRLAQAHVSPTEVTGVDSSNKGCFGTKTNLFRESGDFAGNRETWEIFREI